MKEVVCIKAASWEGTSSGTKFGGPKKGEIVTVTGEYVCRITGLLAYLLLEYPVINSIGESIGYVADNFADIADISELQSILETQPQEI